MDMLRFATAGSVDDGKSTLIGRLLYDTKADLRGPARGGRARPAATRGDEYTNLALLTDGLRAEREQGITIDVAYRYFATPEAQVHHRRHPGPHPVHPQHGHRRLHRRPGARSWSTPARAWSSRAAGTRSSPRCCGCRTWCCASTRWTSSTTSQEVFERDPRRVHRVRDQAATSPTSRSSRSRRCTATTSSPARENMPWYDGPVAAAPPGERARRLATATWSTSASRCSTSSARSPTTYHDYRGYAGQVAGGVLQAGRRGRGAARRASPRGSPAIDTADGPVDEAFPPMSVTVRLEDDLDVSRGDMICRPNNAADASPRTSTRWSAGWTQPSRCGRARSYAIKHTTRTARARWSRTCSTASTSTRCTATRRPTSSALNEIGRVRLRTTAAAAVRRRTAATAPPAAFILIDEATNRTVGAGMITAGD